ncbi:hypothetical protein [Streptomyces sp. NPDC058291]|uniref:hypothetical protein n=1 Tax=Streptomyces sp. NPDC058291 TaxID=3346427 RepID=UPI0036ED2DE3
MSDDQVAPTGFGAGSASPARPSRILAGPRRSRAGRSPVLAERSPGVRLRDGGYAGAAMERIDHMEHLDRHLVDELASAGGRHARST